MTDNHDIDALRELLVPYQLGELAADERARVERALDADPSLRRELDELQDIGARLVSSMPITPAPVALRARVLDAVLAGVEHAPDARPVPAAPAMPVALDAPEQARLEPVAVAPRAPRAPRRRWFTAPAFSGALAAACLVLAVVAVDLSRDLDTAERRADRLKQQAETTVRVGGPPAGFEDAKPFAVAMSDPFEGVTGSLIRVADDTWILMLNNVPTPAKGHSWQLWTAHENGVVQNVAQWARGGAHAYVVNSADITEVMVSAEPTTAPAPAPTGAPVADVKV